MDQQEVADFLQTFFYLNITQDAIIYAIELMKKHNLLPNDAMILANCILQNIKVLASHDSDFATACKEENILLLTNISNLDFMK